METSVLYMTFKNAIGNTCTFTVEDPLEEITSVEVKAMMEKIISLNIFLPRGYSITTMVSAKIVNKDTIEYDLEV